MTTQVRHTAADLAFVADALLALVGQDPDAPYFTDQQFDAREARIAQREKSVDATLVELAEKAQDPFFAYEVASVVARSGLTDRQAEVFGLRLQGYTFEQIADVRQTSKQAAMSVFVQGLKKVDRAVRGYAFLDLGDCYREDCRRRCRKGRRPS